MVDCRNLKKMLAAKHKSIAAKLFEVLEKKTKEYADGVMDEFRCFTGFLLCNMLVRLGCHSNRHYD